MNKADQVELPYEPDWDVEVDIHQVTKRLQGFPSVIFHVEDIHALEPSMDIEDNGPSRINLECTLSSNPRV